MCRGGHDGILLSIQLLLQPPFGKEEIAEFLKEVARKAWLSMGITPLFHKKVRIWRNTQEFLIAVPTIHTLAVYIINAFPVGWSIESGNAFAQ